VAIGGLDHHAGKLLIGLPGGGEVASNAAVAFRQWHHLVLRRNGRSLDLFLDGRHIQRAEIPQESVNIAKDTTFFGGSSAKEISFEGKLDEIAVFSEPLTDEQLKKLGE